MGEYRYAECGLDSVLIEGMDVLVDDGGKKSITIPNINGLHRVIALGIVRKKNQHQWQGAPLPAHGNGHDAGSTGAGCPSRTLDCEPVGAR